MGDDPGFERPQRLLRFSLVNDDGNVRNYAALAPMTGGTRVGDDRCGGGQASPRKGDTLDLTGLTRKSGRFFTSDFGQTIILHRDHELNGRGIAVRPAESVYGAVEPDWIIGWRREELRVILALDGTYHVTRLSIVIGNARHIMRELDVGLGCEVVNESLPLNGPRSNTKRGSEDRTDD